MKSVSMRRVVAALVFASGAVVSVASADGPLPNGVASGDTTQNSTVLWARPATAGQVTFEYSTDPNFSTITGSGSVNVADAMVPAKLEVGGLNAGVQYYYRATDSSNNRSAGKFKTPNAQGVQSGFHMGVSGDWRGELAPYPAVRNVASKNLDLWVSHGDTIYADVATPDVPANQATTLDEYRRKHNEVYTPHLGLNTLADLRSSTSILATFDDHEVTNDFAGGAHPSSDPRFAGQPGNFINETPLYNNGIQAFHEYHPIAEQHYGATGDARTAGKIDISRTRTYGKDAAVFTVDARSFRDQELPAANPLSQASVGNFLVQSFNPSRTMLGRAQMDKLKSDLSTAQADGTTWKFVMLPEPIQNLGVLGASDRMEGYAAERTELLRHIDQNHIQNVVFVTADIHGTLVNNLTYQNGPGQAQIHTGAFEISTGSVAYDAPFGPTVAGLAYGLNLPGALNPAVYAALPAATQEAYITGLVNAQITALGYDPLGLQGSEIPATLLQGGYTATNSFGWTEFNVDPVTQQLMVTTWGVPAYTRDMLLANPAAIAALEPRILSQFVVSAVPAPSMLALAGVAGLVAGRRRR
jgi:phosphodiesterase/alkaline phosphatase D-like protein